MFMVASAWAWAEDTGTSSGGSTGTTNVAKIGDTEYPTIQDAINACPTNDSTTITLMTDVEEGASFGFPDNMKDSGRKIVLDLDGKTYKFKTPAMGSTGYESQAMHLINGNTLTVKDGTLAINPETTVIKRLIQNYCNLTLENVKVDTENVPSGFSNYNNSFCRGTVTLKGNTVFKASQNAIIFDIDGTYCSKPNGGNVGLVIAEGFTGSISGKIEYVPSTNANYTSQLTDNAKYLKAKIGNDYFATIEDAVSYATNGATIELLNDVNTDKQIEIPVGKEVVLDLKGHKIEYTGSTTLSSGVLLVRNGAGLTIKGQEEGSEINAGTKAYAAIAVTKKDDDASNSAKLTIESGTITGYYYGIVGNGDRHNTEITINGGTITGTYNNDNLGIYHPQEGILTITGGQIEGYNSAIELRAGTLNISGGTFKSTATPTTVSANGSGNTTVGAAIAIAQHTTKIAIDVNISGGNFSGCTGLTVFDPQNNNDAEHVKVTISGGTINATSNGINAKYGTVNISGGTIEGQTNFGVAVDKCTVNISGTANITSQEFTVGTGYGTGAIVNISGGTLTARDNAVIGGNGNKTDKNNAERVNPNKFNISGGTFNGKIQSSGYVACGIYAPWKDEFNITGGTFIINGGAGIVARAGKVNISGGEFNCTGGTSGKVGDSKIEVPGSAIVFDKNSNYPGLDGESCITVTGGKFSSPSEVATVICSNEADNKLIRISGGTFSAAPNSKFIVDNFKSFQEENMYIVKMIEMQTEITEDLPITGSSDEGSSDLTDEERTEANNAITQSVQGNKAVSDFTETNTDQAISTDATATETDMNGKTLIDIIQDAVNSEVGSSSTPVITAEDIMTGVKVVLQAATYASETESGTGKVLTRMEFDIKPIATVVVGDKKVETNVPNSLIKQKIKFRLPVDQNVTLTAVEVFHEGVSMGYYQIESDGNGNKYIEVEAQSFSTYSYELASSVPKMKAYHVGKPDGEDININVDKWQTILSDHPNAVAIVDETDLAFAEGNKNVLVEYTNNGTKTYVCPIFELTDLKDFYTPVDFIAKTGEYSRTPNCKKEGLENVKFNSVCLPFELNNGDLSETAQLLSFTSYNTSYVYFNTKDKIEAGVPCLVYEDTNDWNTIRFNNTNIVASPITSTNIQGTFATRSDWANSNDYYSVNKENKFSKLYNTLSAFRSCLYLKFTTPVGGSTKAAQTRGLGIVIDGNEQGTTDIDFIDAEVEQDNGNVYNLNGQKMNGTDLERGFYIKNNKKIFVK